MQKRKLGKSNLEVSAIGLGCMGMSFGYGPAGDKQEMISADPVGRRTRRHVLRHGRSLWPVHQRGTRRRSPRPVPRPGRHRHQVRLRLRRRQAGRPRTASPSTSGRSSKASLKRLKIETIDLLYQHRVDPNVPIEDVAGDGQGTDSPGQGEAFRPVRSRRADHPPRARGPAGDRAAERILALVARARSGGPADARRTGHRLRSVQPSGQRLPHRQDQREHQVRQRTTFATSSPASTRRTARPIRPWSRWSRNLRSRRRPRPRRSRWRGCWRRSRGSFPFPAPPNFTASTRTSEQSPSSSRRRTCATLESAAAQRSAYKARATRNTSRNWLAVETGEHH